jgi:hypothetical protein
MSQDYLAHNLNWRSRAARVDRRVPPQVMWLKVDFDQLPSLLHDRPGGSVCDRKNPPIGWNTLSPDIIFEPFSHLLRHERRLRFPPALRIIQGDLPVFNVPGSDFQDLPYLNPPRAISSSMSLSLGLLVLKMISSTTSFSRIFQILGFGCLKSFFRIGLSQGF